MIRLARLTLALALLKVGYAALDVADRLRHRVAEKPGETWVAGKPMLAGPQRTHEKPGPNATRIRPIEQMLLGSIVALAICALWIWLSLRAGR